MDGAPHPIGRLGNVATFERGKCVIAFLFGVNKMGKIRSCGDLKYTTTDLYCAAWAPIKLPTWDHIAQMTLGIKSTSRAWSFLKTDHQSEYKKLPLDQAHANLAMVALRDPSNGAWIAFPPRPLLFGSEAEVIRNIAFPRAAAIWRIESWESRRFHTLATLGPSDIEIDALGAVRRFDLAVGISLKDDKTGMCWGNDIFRSRWRIPDPGGRYVPKNKFTRWESRSSALNDPPNTRPGGLRQRPTR